MSYLKKWVAGLFEQYVYRWTIAVIYAAIGYPSPPVKVLSL